VGWPRREFGRRGGNWVWQVARRGGKLGSVGSWRRRVMVAAGWGVAAFVAVAGGFAAAGMGGDDPLMGEEYKRAVEAALAHTGGGVVVEADEEGDALEAYDVEVQLADGSRVEVELDAEFRVLRSEPDEDDSERVRRAPAEAASRPRRWAYTPLHSVRG
jgi:hypothetical protein